MMTYLHQLLISLKDPGFYFLLLLVILCLSAIWYYFYTIYAAIAFFSHSTPNNSDFHPPVTILKPICGLDLDTYENFASFCQQDYPEYQIIFGVRDAQDPCVEVVKKLIHNFPEIDIRLVVSDEAIGTNLKVSNLAHAYAHAKYSILLLADSDIRVGSDYLKRIVQPMRDPDVGVVTCLYRPLVRGWVAILEAVGISTDYHAGVFAARKLEGMKFALGPTIAIRKTALEAIGGFAAIADYLADDYQLGYQPTQAGYQVVLSDYIIDHVIRTESLSDLIHRQIRWAYCGRVSRPGSYLGLIFTQGIAASLLLLIVTRGALLAWVVAGVTWMARLAMGWVVGVSRLGDPVAKKFLWLIPISDLIGLALWCYSLFGNTINWRGRQLRLVEDGKLVPIATDSATESQYPDSRK
jgi:ceramide glucosyltransferase